MTTTSTIAEQVADYHRASAGQLPSEVAEAFTAEQRALAAAGGPSGVAQPGTRLPDGELLDVAGQPATLAQTLSGKPAVIVFYRGCWCPYCNITLKTYQDDLLPALRERGVELVAISPQTPAGSEKSVAAGDLEFTVLSDPGNVLSRALGIATEPSVGARGAQRELGFDMADDNVDGSAEIPFPTVLVIDGDGRVVFVDIHTDYTSRTEVSLVLETLDLLELGVV